MARKRTEAERVIQAESGNAIMREAMQCRGTKQALLAEKLGMAQPSLSGNMNRSRIGLDVFVKILNAMEYDVVVQDRETGEVVWKVER